MFLRKTRSVSQSKLLKESLRPSYLLLRTIMTPIDTIASALLSLIKTVYTKSQTHKMIGLNLTKRT